jgi:hypothetical protein
MNSPFVQARARGLAKRVKREAETDEKKIQLAFKLSFCRLPDAQEATAAAAFLEQFRSASGKDAADAAESLAAFCQALLATAEFRNLD